MLVKRGRGGGDSAFWSNAVVSEGCGGAILGYGGEGK